jgi:stearoyl-CoA desaturase (delta-9 desaturase)
MHRRLIHRAYDCPLWLERLLVYLGTLVGMAGPYGMIRQHDMRDWAQRKRHCHAYLAHRSSLLRDGWWQLHCELELVNPPELVLERRVAEDRFYQAIERGWMAQQMPWAALFFAIGGVPWLVWGIAARIAASVTGHWLVGHFAHNRGPRSWHLEGAGVQGFNVPYCGLITMGEAWHNNHHAFPGSARLGLRKGEIDPGWWVLVLLAKLGLVWNVKTPEMLPPRPNLVALGRPGGGRGVALGCGADPAIPCRCTLRSRGAPGVILPALCRWCRGAGRIAPFSAWPRHGLAKLRRVSSKVRGRGGRRRGDERSPLSGC